MSEAATPNLSLIESRDYSKKLPGTKEIQVNRHYVFHGKLLEPGKTYYLPEDVHAHLSESVQRFDDKKQEQIQKDREAQELARMTNQNVAASPQLSAERIQELIDSAVAPIREQLRGELREEMYTEIKQKVLDDIAEGKDPAAEPQPPANLTGQGDVPEGAKPKISLGQ